MDVSKPLKRKAITDLERRNIRRRHYEHPASQSQLITWYEQQPGGRKLTQGQISSTLSEKYAYLDSDTRKKKALGAKRHYKGDYPDFEAALFEWQQRMQKKKATITGDILKAKATEIWNRLPQYNEIQAPKWSNGWLGGFKTRFKIKQYVQHGEAAAADIHNPEAIQQMDRVRSLCSTYADKDIFNMDETGLFWKMSPDRTLATEAQSGGKKSKDRITVALTTNADGSEKLEPWIIGKSKNPRCFKHINLKLLRIQYRYNKSKWMTGLIMEEFLQWFDKKMRGKKVLLLMDNFSAHELGVELVGGKQGLQNVRIEWLPTNITSVWQPCDQGIIAAFKLQYRKLWVSYILRQLEVNKNPNKTVNLLKALQWTRIAWNDKVTPEKIQKCWWKSTVILKPLDNTTQVDTQATEIAELQQHIASIPNIQPLPIDKFINPGEEVVEDNEEDILEAVVELYSEDLEGEAEVQDEDDIEVPKVPISEAIHALETLQQFILQCNGADQTSIQALDKVGRDIVQERISSAKQRTIEGFFPIKGASLEEE
jgi:hypothetical protein